MKFEWDEMIPLIVNRGHDNIFRRISGLARKWVFADEDLDFTSLCEFIR